jgi:Family of unknown function (DUF6125)
MNTFERMSREGLLKALRMFAKNWLPHDGCWFLAVEREHGLDQAIRLDTESWAHFATVEARRIMSTFDIPQNGGLNWLNSQRLLELLTRKSLRLVSTVRPTHPTIAIVVGNSRRCKAIGI